jgi:uncharacterized protein YukE
MSISLDPEQAVKVLGDIEQQRQSIVNRLSQYLDTRDAMMGADWAGSSADSFTNKSNGHAEDFGKIIGDFNSAVQLGEDHIKQLANADQG